MYNDRYMYKDKRDCLFKNVLTLNNNPILFAIFFINFDIFDMRFPG